MRADAQRNVDALIEAAREIFAESGVDAPVREITGRAGVGLATFYRHFPDRADLVTAVFRHDVDACAGTAVTLAAEHEPYDALVLWLRDFTGFLRSRRGLAAAVQSGNPDVGPLPAYFRERFEPALAALLTAAADAGTIRGDVDAGEFLSAVKLLCSAGSAATNERMVALLVDGLRYGAPVDAA
ncbi:TetR/AcrR family transcriptional regulator [Symbioplanes lichenis]|uniref:TetR/AcrR family transcriptional regulator n=1 Tax=Symbioplanes lichenis TaxID=1629072 RepID=UPI002739DD61|nr:TetR/AcrR family transcriptional regulator [Actinoplanes lichenis]